MQKTFHKSSISLRGSGSSSSSSSSASTAIEEPNTLQSKQTTRIIDILGEGDIGGLVDGAKSIIYDGTPIMDSDGNYVIEGVSYQERTGTSNQEPFEGQNEVVRLFSVSLGELMYDVPQTQTINDESVTAVIVTILVSGLYKQTDEGDLVGTSVGYKIEYKPYDGNWVEAVVDTFSGKTTSQYTRAKRIQLTGEAPWNIRVTRTSKDNDSAKVGDTISWAHYQEVIEHKYSYPDSAGIALDIDSETAGTSIGSRGYIVDGAYVQVPSNYDTDTREYSGIWDGEFKSAITNNPAWCVYALLTNKRWGLGRFLGTDLPIKWQLYRIAQYCDELISDGKGGTEPRFLFDYCLTTQQDAFQYVQAIASCFRAIVFKGPSTISIVQDAPSDPVMLVSPSNVENGIINYSTAEESSMFSCIEAVWNNPDDNYNVAVTFVDDPDLIEKYGPITERLVCVGCTRLSQARRAARWALESIKYTTVINYVAGMDHAGLMPGDIIAVADPAVSNVQAAGRLKYGSKNILVLDRDITFNPNVDYNLSLLAKKIDVTLDGATIDSTECSVYCSSINFVSKGFEADLWIIISGFDESSNQGRFKVQVVTENKIYMDGEFVDEVSTKSISITCFTVIETTVNSSGGEYAALGDENGNALVDDYGNIIVAPVSSTSISDTVSTSIIVLNQPLPYMPTVEAEWLISYSNVEPQLFRITSIKQSGRSSFEITGNEYNASKYDIIDNETIDETEDYYSSIPTGSLTPPSNLSLYEYLYRSGTSISSAVTISWTPASDVRVDYYEVQVMYPDTTTYLEYKVTKGVSVDLVDTVQGTYGFRVRSRDSLGRISTWLTQEKILNSVYGNPGDVTSFRSQVVGDQLYLSWTPVTDLDLDHYVIRYTPDLESPTWISSTILVESISSTLSQISVPAADGSYLIKAVDMFGVYSVNETITQVSAVGLISSNVIETIEENPSFPGSKTGLVVLSDKLQLDSSTYMSDWASLSDVETLRGYGTVSDGTYIFNGSLDLGDVYTSKVSPYIDVFLDNLSNVMSSWDTLSEVEALSGTNGTEATVDFQYRTTDDNPSGSPVWSDWKTLAIGNYTFRGIQFRLLFHSDVIEITPKVSELSAIIDMPDRLISGEDLTCPTTGISVSFDVPFKSTRPAVVVDIQDSLVNDVKTITSITASGFHLSITNGGSGVSRTFDYFAKGYGVKAS